MPPIPSTFAGGMSFRSSSSVPIRRFMLSIVQHAMWVTRSRSSNGAQKTSGTHCKNSPGLYFVPRQKKKLLSSNYVTVYMSKCNQALLAAFFLENRLRVNTCHIWLITYLLPHLLGDLVKGTSILGETLGCLSLFSSKLLCMVLSYVFTSLGHFFLSEKPQLILRQGFTSSTNIL